MDRRQAFGETEGEIIDAFLGLMREKPYRKITVKELTGRCCVARTTFYRFFEDTDDLLDQIERFLLDELHLYRRRDRTAEDDELAGMPFESIERWCETGMRLRSMLGPLMGPNGDVYFKERLQAQVRRELNVMMDDDRTPRDRLRPYYVAMLAAAHIGLLGQVAGVEDESELIGTHEMAVMANSGRVAYFRSVEAAPAISDKRLFGGESEG